MFSSIGLSDPGSIVRFKSPMEREGGIGGEVIGARPKSCRFLCPSGVRALGRCGLGDGALGDEGALIDALLSSRSEVRSCNFAGRGLGDGGALSDPRPGFGGVVG